jgi:hypothetical protein
MLFTVKSEKLKLRLTEAVRDALGGEPARRQKPSACSRQVWAPVTATQRTVGSSLRCFWFFN